MITQFKYEPDRVKDQAHGTEYMWDTPLATIYAFVPYGQDDPTNISLFAKTKSEAIATTDQVDAIVAALRG